MQKLKKKPNANVVGVDAHIDPLKQNGITLIALIITIIVMLILVGVTINVVLNGGLFNSADDATKRTEKHSIHEQIIAAMKLTDNGNVNVKGTYDEVVKIFGYDKVKAINPAEVTATTTEVTFEVTGKRGTYTYKITGTKIDVEEEKDGENPEELVALQKYIFGVDGTGRNPSDIWYTDEIEKNGDYVYVTTFYDYDETPEVNADDIELLFIVETESNMSEKIYLSYENKVYSFSVDTDNEITDSQQGINLVYAPSGREGELVQYDGDGDGEKENWTILYDNGKNIEIVSNEVMGSLILGYEDENDSDLTTDIDGNGAVDDIDKAIYSYDNAITRINNYCDEIIKATDNQGVRSIGAEEDNAPYHTSENFETYYTAANKETVRGNDTAYEQDVIRLLYWDVIDRNTFEGWIASRVIDEWMEKGDFTMIFRIRSIFDAEYLYSTEIYRLEGDTFTNDKDSSSYGVLPVVKNPSGI